MQIIKIDGKTKDKNIQLIIVDKKDKYGVGMIAYFKNSLNGDNVQGLAVKNKNDVQFLNDRINNRYILKLLGFCIAKDCVITNYNNFRQKYDLLIKDKISHL